MTCGRSICRVAGPVVRCSTGFEYYRHIRIPADEPPPLPSDDELELERDMEYFVEPEEALGRRTGDPLAE